MSSAPTAAVTRRAMVAAATSARVDAPLSRSCKTGAAQPPGSTSAVASA